MERILRRETHSSRAAASIVAAALVAGICGYALLEAAVRAIGQPPWIIAPQAAAEQIIALPAGVPPLLLGALGAVLAMAGLVFLLHAVLPGRRARHVLRTERAAVVVDDEVIAAALARQARLAANVTQEQVMVVVSRREVLVSIRPTSGVPLKSEAVPGRRAPGASGDGTRTNAGSPAQRGNVRGGRGMNNTPRLLNRILIGILGLQLLAVGVLLMLLAAVPAVGTWWRSWAGGAWSMWRDLFERTRFPGRQESWLWLVITLLLALVIGAMVAWVAQQGKGRGDLLVYEQDPGEVPGDIRIGRGRRRTSTARSARRPPGPRRRHRRDV